MPCDSGAVEGAVDSDGAGARLAAADGSETAVGAAETLGDVAGCAEHATHSGTRTAATRREADMSPSYKWPTTAILRSRR